MQQLVGLVYHYDGTPRNVKTAEQEKIKNFSWHAEARVPHFFPWLLLNQGLKLRLPEYDYWIGSNSIADMVFFIFQRKLENKRVIFRFGRIA